MYNNELNDSNKLSLNLEYCFKNEGTFVFEAKLCAQVTEQIISFLMWNLDNEVQPMNVVYLVTKKKRAMQISKTAKKVSRPLVEITQDYRIENSNNKLIITDLQTYVSKIFDDDQLEYRPIRFIFVQCFDVVEEFNGCLSGQISDTQIRRAWIQLHKLIKKVKGSILEKTQRQAIENLFGEGKKLIESNRNKSSTYFSSFSSIDNHLVCLSVLSYIIGYFQKMEERLREGYSKTGQQFVKDFQNKTLLNRRVIRKVCKFLPQINNKFHGMSTKYITEICEFLKKIIICQEIFGENYKKFTVKMERIEKDAFKSVDTTEANFYIRFRCEDETIVLDLLKNSGKSICLVQNMFYPKQMFNFIFKDKIRVKNILTYKTKCQNIIAINISTTPSKQDLTFKGMDYQSEQFDEIIRSMGVCVEELVCRIPDGIVVYVPSYGFIHKCIKQWQRSQKIYQRINEQKKIFIEKQTEIENLSQIGKFKKYCDNGSGGLMLMSYNSQTAQCQNFYAHYSRCIIFMGYPAWGNRKAKDYKQKWNIERMLNEHLNHCINDSRERKAVVFMGRDFLDLKLETWFPFIQDQDCITFDGVDKVCKSFQLKPL